MEMEVVWSGSTWRAFPAPDIAREPDPVLVMRSTSGYAKGEKRAMVAAAMGHAFASLKMLQDRTGLTASSVLRWADRLVEDGFAERIAQPSPMGGNPRVLYRRTARTEAAA